MNKTEQLIQAYFANPITEEPLITELRRLAKLNEAYWRECQAWRKKYNPHPISGFIEATDAARREAGEL